MTDANSRTGSLGSEAGQSNALPPLMNGIARTTSKGEVPEDTETPRYLRDNR